MYTTDFKGPTEIQKKALILGIGSTESTHLPKRKLIFVASANY